METKGVSMKKIGLSLVLGLFALSTAALAQSAHAPSAPDDAWLGVTIERIDDEDGVRILSVFEDSPAQRAGLRKGDIITRIGADEFNTLEGFVHLVREAPIGRRIEFGLVRVSGKSRETTIRKEQKLVKYLRVKPEYQNHRRQQVQRIST